MEPRRAARRRGAARRPRLLRLAIIPEAQQDEELARQIAADVTPPQRGVLPPGSVAVEARFVSPLHALLVDQGWERDEPWTGLRRDLAEPVPNCRVRIEVSGPQHVGDRVSVQRAAFDGSTFSEERWRAMASGPAYAEAQCLVAYDEPRTAVATATVWSAGHGKPGLLEPMGIHRDHRGRGFGTAITVAAAAALQRMGSSSATVATRSANVGGVATYRSAGFQALPEVRDLRRRDG